MAIIRLKELKQMKAGERNERLKELMLEKIKAAALNKKGNKTREIKKTIARILTLNKHGDMS